MSVTDKIRPHVATILDQDKAGNEKARRIIELHHMHVKCPSDPGAEGLCSAAFDDWLKDQTANAR